MNVTTTATVPPARPTLAAFARAESAALLAFLARPTRSRRLAGDRSHLILRPLFLLLVAALCILTISVPLDHLLIQFTSGRERDIDHPAFVYAALLLAPLAEELVFRAGLRSARYTLGAGLPLLALFVGLTWLAGLLLAALGLVWLYQRHDRPGDRVRRARAYLRRYPAVFWLWTTSFAFAHLLNFQSSDWTGIFLFAFVTPQFAIGVLLAYLRLRQGLASAIAVHTVYNAMAIGLLTLFT